MKKSQVDGENPNVNLNSNDVIICVLPLFHIYSLNSVLLCGLRVGAAILILQKYDMSSLLHLIQTHKATIAPFVPPIVLDFAKNPDIQRYDLSSIRIVMSGAAPMGKDLEDTVKARLPNATLGQVILNLSEGVWGKNVSGAVRNYYLDPLLVLTEFLNQV